MQMPTTTLVVISGTIPREMAETVIDALAEQGLSPATWEDVELGVTRVQLFLDEAANADDAAAALVNTGRALGFTIEPEKSLLPREDWAESWKRFFHVEHPSERIVIRPSWEKYTARPGEVVIDLDPGMSFGTGRHGTTRACLAFLDQLAVENSKRDVLDMGCGSGILAIAARKLGFAPVAAFDNDPDAVVIARENAEINRVRDIDWQVRDLAASEAQAHVVVANILAVVLIEHAARIAAAVRPGPDGALILSGILDKQYADVRAAYVAQGFIERETLLRDEWRSGLFVRK